MLSVDNSHHMMEMKFRPQSIAECILPRHDIERFNGLIKLGRIPHLLLCSKSPGTGKTTTALALANDVDADVMFISGGNLRINDLRTTLTDFASTSTRKKGGKIIIIDEGDNDDMSAVQKELRSWMEAYGGNCTIIMTCNNIEKIIDPLRSRFRIFEFGKVVEESEELVKADELRMMKEMIVRCFAICKEEGIEIRDKNSIAALVKKNFPNFRTTITEMNKYAACGYIDEGVLTSVNRSTKEMEKLFELIKAKKVQEIRQLVPNFSSDYVNFVNAFYERATTQVTGQSYRMMIKILAEFQKFASTVPNMEIHLMDMLSDMACEVNWK
ncbi:clamp loader subunit [Aeromonas phage AS-yj]|uniref:Sliding-clamp-loader large subunit n=6 Tax=Caudoviricetes TaxID=2731619 RepID=A0A291LDR9_9CAUD|nr:clamp loader subunit [Aeromonas phage AS-zj]YP_009834967.1 clamp loader subunit [Aeromonas phage AS-sw]ATI17481.1 clamp loader subunit [Aeromonas phage AS-szw]ATI18030.1 clamp loader subunit [Aeromonas phage AS-yj]QAX97921.1 clamp loader subunit [Aeromonas phage Asswx_1]QAX99028.1 clamp loader subunit [Aeromonas phage Assk]QMV28808.1 DNA polymerase accessory protein [Aeromonas phage AP1]UKM62549.1 putative DNA polymerase clamp loader subunit [Aeromonas phage P19]